MIFQQVKFGQRTLAPFEAACLAGALELSARLHAGQWDAAAQELRASLRHRVPADRLEAAARLMEQASEALHPGRGQLPVEQVADAGIVQSSLLDLLDNDLAGYRGKADAFRLRAVEAEARARAAAAGPEEPGREASP